MQTTYYDNDVKYSLRSQKCTQVQASSIRHINDILFKHQRWEELSHDIYNKSFNWFLLTLSVLFPLT